MALSTARIPRVRGRPPLLAAGITSLIHSHSSSVRSLGYVFSFIYPCYTTHEDFSDRLSGPELLAFLVTGKQDIAATGAEIRGKGRVAYGKLWQGQPVLIAHTAQVTRYEIGMAKHAVFLDGLWGEGQHRTYHRPQLQTPTGRTSLAQYIEHTVLILYIIVFKNLRQQERQYFGEDTRHRSGCLSAWPLAPHAS